MGKVAVKWTNLNGDGGSSKNWFIKFATNQIMK